MVEEFNSKSPHNINPDENRIDSRDNQENFNVREQDRFLPIANVSKIMKKDLTCHAKIAKDAKEMMQECVSEFISFVTNEAIERCKREKKKTVNGDDLLWAMGVLGFKDYVEVLRIYMGKYRETQVGDKESTMDKPRDTDSRNQEGAGPPTPPAAQMGPSSAYHGGMPYMQLETPLMMKPNNSQIHMPPKMPHMMRTPDNYQLQNQMVGALGNQQL